MKKYSTAVCIAILCAFMAPPAFSQDDESMSFVFFKDQSRRPIRLTGIEKLDWTYIVGKYKTNKRKIVSFKVKKIQYALTTTEDNENLVVGFHQDGLDHEVPGRDFPLRTVIIVWERVERRAHESRFNDATRMYLHGFKNDPIVAEHWPAVHHIAHYYYAEQLFHEGEYEKAIQSYKDLLDKFPTSHFAMDSALKISQAYMELKDFQQAGAMLNSAIDDMLKKYSRDVSNVRDLKDQTEMRRFGRQQERTFNVYMALNLKTRAAQTKEDSDIDKANRAIGNAYDNNLNREGMEDALTLLALAKLDLMLVNEQFDETIELCKKDVSAWESSGDSDLESRMPSIFLVLGDAYRNRASKGDGSLQSKIDTNWARWYYMHVSVGFPDNPVVLEKSLYYTGWSYLKMMDLGEEKNVHWKLYWKRLKEEFPDSAYLGRISEFYPNEFKEL